MPGALALIEVTKAQVKSVTAFVQKFANIYPGSISEWTNKEKHNQKTAILSGETYPTIVDYIEYLFHLISTFLNVILNMTVLAILISPMLLISYAIGILLAGLILRLQKNAKKRLALKAQQSRIKWTNLLLKAWDNILLNNIYNLNIWNAKAAQRAERLVGKNVELAKFSQSISILMAFALIGPSILLISYLAVTNLQNHSFLAILAVILPRLFQILNFSYELLYLLADLPLHNAKMTTIFQLVDHDKDKNKDEIKDRINWDKINASQKHSYKANAKESIPQLLLEPLPGSGRITIQGENGSGKTSLLLTIKMKYGDQAFYLPAQHELLFNNKNRKQSTGQQAMLILKELQENLSAPIILLDEWDANLDQKNRSDISTLIDILSKKSCVIETLHSHQL